MTGRFLEAAAVMLSLTSVARVRRIEHLKGEGARMDWVETGDRAPRIADLAQLAIPFLRSAVITREYVIEERPELLGNFARAVVEGIHFLKTKPRETIKIFQKYFRTNDVEALQDAYDEYVGQIGKLPYAEAKAVQTVLRATGETQPAALKASPEQFIDDSHLRKIERSGFVEKLYGG